MASTTEELEAQILAEMEANPEAYLVEPVNDIITIDPETRTINVPASEALFGARQDMDSERKYFKCPKIVGDNIDLSKCHIYISYVPSKQDGTYDINEDVGSYLCEDVDVDGDYITFSWKLSGNVFVKAGSIAFSVYAKQADSDGILKTKWHTTFAIGKVLDTLPDGNLIAEKYVDVIEQLLNKMENVEQIATPETMQGYVNEYLDENPPSGMTADEKAQLNKNTEDISSLSEEINNLPSSGGSGWSNTAKSLLITILRACATKTDQTANITALETALNSSSGGSSGGVTTYSIISSLTNVTSDNSATMIIAEQGYTATLTPSEGYALENVKVTMGGVDVTSDVYTDGVIVISSVTGDILIIASAIESASAVTSWLYHFDNNVYAEGEKSLGIENSSGTPYYVEGKFGNALATYNGSNASSLSGTITNKPVLDGDFTISMWGANSWRTLTTRNSMLHLAEYKSALTNIGYETPTIYYKNKVTLIDTENWTLGKLSNDPYAFGNAQRCGLNIFWYTTLQVMVMNDDVSNGFAFALTPVNGWDSEWHHYALTRKGNVFYFFVDGKLTVTVEMDSTSNQKLYVADNFAIGAYYGVTEATATTLTNNGGAIDELLIDDSNCRYTESFTVPTSPYVG